MPTAYPLEFRARPVAAGETPARDGSRDPQACFGLLREGERSPKMIFTFITERCSDLPVAVVTTITSTIATATTTSANSKKRERPQGGEPRARRHADPRDVWSCHDLVGFGCRKARSRLIDRLAASGCRPEIRATDLYPEIKTQPSCL